MRVCIQGLLVVLVGREESASELIKKRDPCQGIVHIRFLSFALALYFVLKCYFF